MKYKNVVVTGSNGFIMSQLVEHLLDNDLVEKVLCIDKMSVESTERINKKYNNDERFIFATLDIAKSSELVHAVLDKFKPTLIIDGASESHVDRSIDGPKPFIQNNINCCLNMLEYVRQNPEVQYSYVGSDESYGDCSTKGIEHFTVKTGITPSSPYSASKASSECMVMSYIRTYGIHASISRCSNNFGLYQNKEKMIPTVVRNILAGNDIPVYGDGQQIRDWLPVEEHIRGILMICDDARDWKMRQPMCKERWYADESNRGCEFIPMKSRKFGRDLSNAEECIFNIGGGKEMTNLELIKSIGKILDIEPKLKSVNDRLGHDRKYSIGDSIIEISDMDWHLYFIKCIENYK